ncbi:hypothetical protein CEUSTIGMA_g5804.t1 [Chlamydomonas eustigma]|uniref:Protein DETOXIFICATION n=1 Tax=Chlamydomonas eustigma TaxID=1157962 RepID=A0A250X635_9CHLO|nr:hypothetical protein CEUSTIGMA_g5804.t1 [Chlamydomonas eustigma]|eukprot:GAX78362.1 hypothetical protein CEUSTIGMA_g5804.t1 [Chlamydomonas eustigma]
MLSKTSRDFFSANDRYHQVSVTCGRNRGPEKSQHVRASSIVPGPQLSSQQRKCNSQVVTTPNICSTKSNPNSNTTGPAKTSAASNTSTIHLLTPDQSSTHLHTSNSKNRVTAAWCSFKASLLRTLSATRSSLASSLGSGPFSLMNRSPYDAAIMSMAAPAVLALAADPLLAMVDTALVGQLGQSELAALGVNNSVFGMAFVVFNFLSTATTPMVAAALGADDKQKAGQTLSQALLLALVLGLTVSSTLYLNADHVLQLMGLDIEASANVELTTLARDFLMIRCTAAPAALLVTVSQGAFRSLQDMRTPLVISVATNVLHLFLSLILIFPLPGIPGVAEGGSMGMGLSGAAVSTSVAEWLAAGTYLYLMWGKRADLGLDSAPQLLNPGEAARQYTPFLKAGGAVLLRTAVLLGTKTLSAAVATRLGPASIASHQVLSQVWILSSLIIDSLAISGQTLVAVQLGKQDKVTARRVTDRLLQLGTALGVTLAAAFSLASPFWPHLFSQDTEVLSAVSVLLPLAVWMLPINAVAYVLDGALVGAEDFGFMALAMTVAAGAAVGALLMVEPAGLGLAGVWQAQAILMLGRAATLGFRYMSPDGPLPPLNQSRLSSCQSVNVEVRTADHASSPSSAQSAIHDVQNSHDAVHVHACPQGEDLMLEPVRIARHVSLGSDESERG